MNLPSTIPTQFWRQAPWRLVAFVAIALLMGGLVTLAPALGESYGLLAVLVAGLGLVTVAIIDRLSRNDEASRSKNRGRLRLVSFEASMKSLMPAMLSGPLSVSPSDGTPLPTWHSAQPRIRFLLEALETCAEPTYRSKIKALADEIQESWDLCFIQHGPSLRRALHTRRTTPPEDLLLWESDPVVGALLEETFEDLGFQVMRMPIEGLRALQEDSSSHCGELMDQIGRFYVEIHRSLPKTVERSFWERDRVEVVPLEQLSSSRLLAEDELPVDQREVVLAALGRLFEKALEAARLQRRNPLHSHGR